MGERERERGWRGTMPEGEREGGGNERDLDREREL